jgi:hypothetical protein
MERVVATLLAELDGPQTAHMAVSCHKPTQPIGSQLTPSWPIGWLLNIRRFLSCHLPSISSSPAIQLVCGAGYVAMDPTATQTRVHPEDIISCFMHGSLLLGGGVPMCAWCCTLSSHHVSVVLVLALVSAMSEMEMEQ